MAKKKGQVSVYVVVGLLLLIASVILFTVRREGDVPTAEEELQRVPSQFHPIFLFVDECVQRVSRDGLELLGRQAGYISVTDKELAGREFKFEGEPTESDGILLGENVAVPYWHMLKSGNKCRECSFEQRVPGSQQIIEGLQSYVQKQVPVCIDNFNQFKSQGYSFEIKGEPKANVLVRTDDVIVRVDYSFDATIGDEKFSFQSFGAMHDVSLSRIIDFGKLVLKQQVDSAFLEYNTMSFISAYGAVKADKIPPIAAETVGPQKVYWTVPQVRNRIQEILLTYIPAISVMGTNNFFPYVVDADAGLGGQLRQGMYNSLVFNLEEEKSFKYDDLDVSFAYLDWPIFFDITPRDGQIVRPEELQQNFPSLLNLFAQSYNFYYDISYPVLVEIRQQDAFNGEGYSFWYALESNVRNNKPLKTTMDEIGEFNQGGASLFGSEVQRISAPVTTTAYNELLQPVSDVQVYYDCGDDSAYIGETSTDGVLTAQYPLCRGGFVVFSKDEYVGDRKPLDTSQSKAESVYGVLRELHKKNVSLYIRDELTLSRIKAGLESEGGLASQTKLISGEDSAYITLNQIGQDGQVINTQVAAFDGNQPIAEISIAPGIYEVSGQFVAASGIYIPARKVTAGKQSVELPEVEVKPATLGGVVLSRQTQMWTADRVFIEDPTKQLDIFMIRGTPPKSHEQLGMALDSALILSKNYTKYIVPRWR